MGSFEVEGEGQYRWFSQKVHVQAIDRLLVGEENITGYIGVGFGL